ncbi:MAG TPA: phosphoribosyltransferase family protein [Actinomycetes bacterium]|nr:phosphoribosyltransferase family protein [Actinomycetes bacterium]
MNGYADRREAGRALGRHLAEFAGQPDVVVLGLPRGGVVVAAEVARSLDAPLDALMVRKLGVPGYEELAMGAIATGGTRVLNQDVIAKLGIPAGTLDTVAAAEETELVRRERAYRGDRAAPDVCGATVILVDDGLATGATMRAAAAAVAAMGATRIVVAVPVAPLETVAEFTAAGIEVVCPLRPARFGGVGAFYANFSQTTDQEVRELLLDG